MAVTVPDSNIPLRMKEAVPVDPTENALKAYSLAGTMVDTQEKIRQRDEGANDRSAIQNYLTGGGDLSTPEGASKALKELQGKVSPALTEKLMAHQQSVTNNFLKQKAMVQELDQTHLQDMAAQDEQAAPMMEKLHSDYQQTLSTQGKAAADAAFEKGKAGLMQWMGQQQLGGRPRFTPDVVNGFQSLTPDSLPYALAHTKYHKTLVDERLASAKANAIENGNGKWEVYTDGKDSFRMNKDTGSVLKNVNGDWEPTAMLPTGAKKIGTSGSGLSGGVKMEPDTVRSLAVTSLITGNMPTRLGPEDKKEIMNEQEKVRGFMGLSRVDAALLPTNIKIKNKALGNLENLGAQVNAFEQSLTNYSQRALENLDKISTTDIPWLNKITQNLEGHIDGLPPNLARLQVNLRAVASEYNKLSSGALGNTQPGEKSLLEIMDMFKKSDNPETLKATLDEVIRDGKFRAKGIKSTQSELEGSIKSGVSKADEMPAPGGSSAPAATKVRENPADSSDRVSILQTEKKKSMDELNSLDPKASDYKEKKARVQADIEALNRELRTVGAKVEDTPNPAATKAPTGKPQPSDADRAYAKAHPETAAKFKAHFGVDP